MKALRVSLVFFFIALLSISLLSISSCKKGEEEAEEIVTSGDGKYEDFLFIETIPSVQDNDVLDIETHIELDWDLALSGLGIIEREDSKDDLWIAVEIVRLEFVDSSDTPIQVIDFTKQSIANLIVMARDNDANPQIYSNIKYYDGGFTINYDPPAVRPTEMTAAIHFPVTEELGHRIGVLKVYGRIAIPEHYENKEGKEGIYELKPAEVSEINLIREVAVDASSLTKVPNYSKRDKITGEYSSTGDEEVIETVTVVANALRLRAKPSLDADVVTTLDNGTKLDVLEKNESWYKVRTPDGQVGWARAYYEGDIYLD